MPSEQIEWDVRRGPPSGAKDGRVAGLLEHTGLVGGQVHFASVV